jgi:hypothetical protein
MTLQFVNCALDLVKVPYHMVWCKAKVYGEHSSTLYVNVEHKFTIRLKIDRWYMEVFGRIQVGFRINSCELKINYEWLHMDGYVFLKNYILISKSIKQWLRCKLIFFLLILSVTSLSYTFHFVVFIHLW